MSQKTAGDAWCVFPSALGWFALIGAGRVLKFLTFGHASEKAARRALRKTDPQADGNGQWSHPLVERLQAYASGGRDDFLDIQVDTSDLTPFARLVVPACRRIPYGRTLTYGQLAAQCGSPAAARAVGNCMARNRFPLVVPCHRVVASGGSLGGYSAPGGVRLKRRLLELESGNVPP
jgi:methylated-DNA-[protein]-cysteine S-methyltransferase